MVKVRRYDPVTKDIEFSDDAFRPELTATFSLSEVNHWNYVARSAVQTRKEFLMSKIRRQGGVSWLLKELRRLKDGGKIYEHGYYIIES